MILKNVKGSRVGREISLRQGQALLQRRFERIESTSDTFLYYVVIVIKYNKIEIDARFAVGPELARHIAHCHLSWRTFCITF
jgi:hypothetical protein